MNKKNKETMNDFGYQIESSICFENYEDYEKFLREQNSDFHKNVNGMRKNERLYSSEELRNNGFIAFADHIL